MQLLRGTSVSVLHGNPYVHLSILDYHDGSAFDLWVLDRQRLIIVPQLKASIPPLNASSTTCSTTMPKAGCSTTPPQP